MRFANRKLPVEVIKSGRQEVWVVSCFILLILVGAVLVVRQSSELVPAIILVSLISALFIGLLLSALLTRIVVDDDGVHKKGLFFARSFTWDDILGCQVEKRQRRRDNTTVVYFVVILELRAGSHLDFHTSDEDGAKHLMNLIYERLQIGWREGKKCSRCMNDLRKVDAGSKVCSRCSEDLTRDEMKWIEEYHRRKGAQSQSS